ncbi:hypothetical protein Q3G72_018566 [Acer saccharum]|nr:hypothetical protein Q3G72_018566 [Acer saccharum]
MKGPYGGVLLSVVALDANSRLYPLAYCICEGETLLSWSWFLRQLRCFLKYSEDRPICFMSDRLKGVIGALKMYWPKASVRAYIANLNDKIGECGQWQVSGVHCCHALAGIRHHFGVNGNQSSLKEFIDPKLPKAAYLRTYNYMIHPIPNLCVCGDHVGAPIQPPPLKRKPERPKLLRKRESTEKPKATRSGSVVCGKCRLPGYNSRTCKIKGSQSCRN